MLTEYYKALSEQAQYDVAAAMRGPDQYKDCDSYNHVKWQVTARLRSIMFSRGIALGDYNNTPITSDQVDVVRTETARILHQAGDYGSPALVSFHHYCDHLKSAIIWSKEHPVWNGLGEDLLRVLRGF